MKEKRQTHNVPDDSDDEPGARLHNPCLHDRCRHQKRQRLHEERPSKNRHAIG